MEIDWTHNDSLTTAICHNVYDGPPTRMCMVCDKLENPQAGMVREVGWLCPDCKKKIGQMIGVRTDD